MVQGQATAQQVTDAFKQLSKEDQKLVLLEIFPTLSAGMSKDEFLDYLEDLFEEAEEASQA